MEEINRFTKKVRNASNRRSPDLRLSLSEASCLVKEIHELVQKNTSLEEALDNISCETSEQKLPLYVNVSGEKF